MLMIYTWLAVAIIKHKFIAKQTNKPDAAAEITPNMLYVTTPLSLCVAAVT